MKRTILVFTIFLKKTYFQFNACFNIYETAQKETDEEKKDELEKSLNPHQCQTFKILRFKFNMTKLETVSI